jgi:threonine synthase
VAEDTNAQGIWRWAAQLPNCHPQNPISLGEGESPLLAVRRLGAAFGLDDLWVKNDAIMPSGSFKDRAIALATSLACEYSREGLILASSGNAGASGAAYAARAGKRLLVLVPKTAPGAKLRQIAAAGAKLVTIDGAVSDCVQLADQVAKNQGWVNLTTTFHNPYGVDAYATISYEIAAHRPDVVVLPIASGPLLVGMMKGFTRLHEQGQIRRIPRPIAVQSAACAPIVRAYRDGTDINYWAKQHTIASAINDTLDGYERDGTYTLELMKRHGGVAVAVDDETLLAGLNSAAQLEGLVFEPSAAITIAALPALRTQGLIAAGERIVVVATGHGLKDLSYVDIDLESAITPNLDTILKSLSN